MVGENYRFLLMAIIDFATYASSKLLPALHAEAKFHPRQ
jgi:hypothetical protein